MQIHGANATISLEAEQSLRIASRGEVEIACLSGLLWVTQPGDVRDLFVAAGTVLRVTPSALTLVTAVRPAMLRARALPASGGLLWRRSRPSPALAAVLRIGSAAGQAARSVR